MSKVTNLSSMAIIYMLFLSGEAVAEDAPPNYVLDHYVETQQDDKEDPFDVSKVSYESKDFDGDGSVEWFLYTTLYCGSGGCTGPVYSKIGEKYCFVAWANSSDLRSKGGVSNLACGDINKYPRVFLEQLIKK